MGKPVSYIQMMINNNGDDWIIALRPEDIQRSSKRIVKDMVRGIIDYESTCKYFLDLKFMENLIIGVSNELEINTLNMNACKFYYQYFPQVPNLGTHIYHLERVVFIYSTILERLNMVKATGNIGYMPDINAILFNDRNHLN